jgi:hypothetical protein
MDEWTKQDAADQQAWAAQQHGHALYNLTHALDRKDDGMRAAYVEAAIYYQQQTAILYRTARRITGVTET